MAETVHASGTTSTAGASEVTLVANNAVSGIYQASLVGFNLSPGNVLTARIYETVLDGGTQRLIWEKSLGSTANNFCLVSPPLMLRYNWSLRMFSNATFNVAWHVMRADAAIALVTEGTASNPSNLSISLAGGMATITLDTTGITAMPGTLLLRDNIIATDRTLWWHSLLPGMPIQQSHGYISKSATALLTATGSVPYSVWAT